MVPWLGAAPEFPPVAQALREPNGLLAAGGDLTPEWLIAAYRRGIFPWYSSGEPILWWSPDPRTVLWPHAIKLSHSLRKVLRKQDFEVRLDTAFSDVVRACSAPRHPGAGTWIKGGAFLCLFGSTLGSLTALGRVSFSLAQSGVLPKALGAVHRRFHTPAAALVATALPLILVGCVLILEGVTASQAYNTLGGFSVLGFLLVYALVAISSLKRQLQGSSRQRRLLVGSGSLIAVSAVAMGYLSAIVGHQNGILISFGGLMLIGVVLVVNPAPRP
jgi:amino acid transporter